MCNFEHIRTARENEEIIVQLEQVSGLSITTIISLFAAGYRLGATQELIEKRSIVSEIDETDRITVCDNCEFLGECISEGQVLNSTREADDIPHYIRNVKANCRQFKPKFEWKDIVRFIKNDDLVYAFESAEISGEMDDPDTYRVDEFIDYVTDKYGVDSDNISLWSMEHFDIFEDEPLLVTVTELCGCYINGVPEWILNE